MAVLLGVVFAAELHAQTSAFTYQGRLTEDGPPANERYDLSFELFHDPCAGSSHGAVTHMAMAVSNGLFTVQLDFGTGVFDGSPRWIEISMRHPAGSGNYATLVPQQEIMPTPVAHFALAGNEGPEGLPGSDALWNVSGVDMYYHLGHVGIGTQNPEYYLDVGRPARFSDNIGVGLAPGTSRISAEAAGLSVAFHGINHSKTPTALLKIDGNGPALLVYSTDEAHPFGGGTIQIGHNETAHLAIHRNEITTALGTGNATLNLNPHGGAVSVGVETATGDSFSQLFVQRQDPHVYALDAEST